MISASRSSASAAVRAAPVAVRLGGLQAALALALEHLHLIGAVVLFGLLEGVRDHAQRVHALALARLHRGPYVILHLIQQRHRLQV